MTPKQPTDRAGRPLNVGDQIAFATRVGNSAEQSIREVVELRPVREDPMYPNHRGARFKKCEPHQAEHIQVHTRVLHDWSQRYSWGRPADKVTKIENLDNTVKLEPYHAER